jgi:hypothetical protein
MASGGDEAGGLIDCESPPCSGVKTDGQGRYDAVNGRTRDATGQRRAIATNSRYPRRWAQSWMGNVVEWVIETFCCKFWRKDCWTVGTCLGGLPADSLVGEPQCHCAMRYALSRYCQAGG